MAKQIGTVTLKREGAEITGTGKIRTRTVSVRFRLDPVAPDPARKKAPTHAIVEDVADPETGEIEAIPIGEAWRYPTNNGENKGGSMFSLMFTDPDFPVYLDNIPAYADSPDDSKPLRIMFDRGRK